MYRKGVCALIMNTKQELLIVNLEVFEEKYCFGFNFTGDENSIHPADGEVRSFKWVQLTELDKYLLFENELEGVVERVREVFKIKV